MVAKSEFALDGDALSEQALAPRRKFVGFHSKCDMSCTGGAVRRQSPVLAGNIRAEEKEYAWARADLESRSASSGKVRIGYLSKAQDTLIESKRAVQI